MGFSLRSALALFSIILPSVVVLAQDTQIPLVCHDDGVQIIAAVGQNVANGSNSYGLTVTFIQDVMGDIPDSSNFSINYNRTAAVNATGFYIPDCTRGTAVMLNAITSYAAACPNTPIVLHGYSLGACVVGNALCGASSYAFNPTLPLNSSYASQSRPYSHVQCMRHSHFYSHCRHLLWG